MKNGKKPDPYVIHPIAAGVESVMNDADHQMNAVSTFPFYTFDDDLIGLLLKFKWWDKSIEEINSLIPILTCSEWEKVRNEIEVRL